VVACFCPKIKEFLLHYLRYPGETMDSVKFYVDTWFAQGVSFDNLNQYENAVEAYRQALRLQPEHADAWYNLGIAYINLKKYGFAALSFEEAVRIEPEKAGAWFNLGVAYYYQDKREKVREIYQVLRKLDLAVAEEYSKAVFTEFKITPGAHYSPPPDV
jgi:tetratricopeptide (TPR) repeat protein